MSEEVKELPEFQEILRLNNIIKTISSINQLLVISKDEKELCRKICKSLVQIKGHKLIWLGLKEFKGIEIAPIAIDGTEKDFVNVVKNSFHKYSFNKGPTGEALKTGKPFLIRNLKNEKIVPWGKAALKKGFLSAVILPLKYYDEVIGMLHIYSNLENGFPDEEVKFLSGVANDISMGIKNLRNEKEIIASEKRFKELIYQLPEMIFETDLRGNITFANDNAFDSFGYDENDLNKGLNILQLVTAGDIKRAIFDFKKTLKGEDKELLEYAALRKDKSTFPMLVKANLLTDDKKKKKGARGIAIDLSERKEMEKKLDISGSLYKTVFEHAGIAKVIIKADTYITMANIEFEKLSGYKKEEVENKLTFAKFVHKDELQKIKNYHNLRRLKPGSAPDRYEARFVDRENNVKNVIVNCSMLPGPKKSLVSFLDITDRKTMEDKLSESCQKLQNVLDEVINIVIFIIEIRDPYTAGHQRRVSALSIAIAEDIALSEDKIKRLKIAADIHDIGKIYVPIELLSKPGKIDEHEFAIIKNHSKNGYQMLKNIDFGFPIADIIFQHHERIDGSGYPQGLKDKDILIEAKIIAVADVVEAITSHRPYRSAYDIKAAIEEIKKNKGILYDPQVVDSCIKLFKRKNFRFSQIDAATQYPPP